MNSWTFFLLGILVGWLLSWLLELWFFRRRRLECQRDKSRIEALLRARNAELGAANSQISALRGELGTRAQEIDMLLYQLATKEPNTAAEPLAEMRRTFPKGLKGGSDEGAQEEMTSETVSDVVLATEKEHAQPQAPDEASEITDEQWVILRAAGITTEEELAAVATKDLQRLFQAPEWQHTDEEARENSVPLSTNNETGAADDMTLISGIGPKYAALLQEHGFTTFAQLAASDPAELSGIFKTTPGRTPDFNSWIEQARAFQMGT